ncbi:MAG: nuclease-related domain-containing protein, partial [Mollicutes bacterium]|nr:nuclease-related domain-containing protein [Mollicutes bacterium]
MIVLYIVIALLVFIFIIAISIALVNKSNYGSEITNHERNAKLYGDIGEKIVGQRLEEIVNTYGGYLYNDFCFEDEYGFSSQIDHILITLGGVFIIETKNMVGTVYGDKDAERWKCIKYQNGNIYEKIIGNPIIQNQGHINHLRDMFASIPPKMTSMVIFVDTDISYIDSNLVYNLP